MAEFPLPTNELDHDEEHEVHELLEDEFDLQPLSQVPDGEFVGDDTTAMMLGMVTAEDEVFFGDIRDESKRGNSAKEKKNNALKHLNFFLKKYSEQKRQPFVRAEDLNFQATEEMIRWWDDMIGCFFSYLAKHAYDRFDSDKKRLAYNTATGYASSVKAYYTNKFRTQ